MTHRLASPSASPQFSGDCYAAVGGILIWSGCFLLSPRAGRVNSTQRRDDKSHQAEQVAGVGTGHQAQVRIPGYRSGSEGGCGSLVRRKGQLATES